MSGDVMTFPETVEEFMEQYKVVDTEKVYTNGIEFVPIFRMKQWFEHFPDVPQEMSAREFGEKWRRLCKFFSQSPCSMCPLYAFGDTCSLPTTQSIAIIEKWAQEHPEKRRKTYAEDFKQKYPKGLTINGIPSYCRETLYKVGGRQLCDEKSGQCEACWNEEMEATTCDDWEIDNKTTMVKEANDE